MNTFPYIPSFKKAFRIPTLPNSILYLGVQLFALLPLLLIGSCAKKSSDPTPSSVSATVATTNPANNATGVPRNTTIAVNFSSPMDPSTINSSTIIVTQGNNVVPGTVTYTGTTATFTPTNYLQALTLYTITITSGATPLSGTLATSSAVVSFTTGGTATIGGTGSGNTGTTALAPVDLGTAINYVILAKTAINNNPTSNITGNLGLSPAATSYITGLSLINATGYATSSQVTGNIYAADMVTPTSSNLTVAINNMLTAYNDAAGRPSPDFVELGAGTLGGNTLTAGLYKWGGNVTVPTNITISGNANDVWIFQIAGNLTLSSAVNVILSGGAQSKNIFWQVAGNATFGTTSHFEGVILSMTGITLKTNASLHGRALAQTAVILDGNVVTAP